MNSKMKSYEAPKGKVYDWAEPHIVIIKNQDGTTTEEEEHLYANFLNLGPRDTLERYKLVKDPREDK